MKQGARLSVALLAGDEKRHSGRKPASCRLCYQTSALWVSVTFRVIPAGLNLVLLLMKRLSVQLELDPLPKGPLMGMYFANHRVSL